MKEISCSEVRELISPYLDGYINDRETETLEEHLKYCMQCAKEIEGYRRISNSLLQLNNISCPNNLAGSVMSRLKEEEPAVNTLQDRIASRFSSARKALAAAAAAALIMASSYGFTAGYRLVANNNENVPEPPPQHYEVAVQNGGDAAGGEVTPAEAGPEPDANDTTPADTPAVPANSDSKPAANNTSPTAIAANGDSTTMSIDRESAVLLDHNIVIESSILKVRITSAAESRQKAVNLAGSYGGNAKILGSQTHNNALVHIVHITIPKSNAPGLMAGLAGLGTELDRQNEQRNITTQYMDLADRYRDLIELKESGAANLDGQIAAAREQLNNWTKEANNYTIVLWLEE